RVTDGARTPRRMRIVAMPIKPNTNTYEATIPRMSRRAADMAVSIAIRRQGRLWTFLKSHSGETLRLPRLWRALRLLLQRSSPCAESCAFPPQAGMCYTSPPKPMAALREPLLRARRIVIKVGTRVATEGDNAFSVDVIGTLVKHVAALK